jgi:Secretion system C-terminal sorting domain
MKRNNVKTLLMAGGFVFAAQVCQAQLPCESAISLSCNSVESGTTVGGWPTPPGGNITAPSQWYSFVGDGQVVRARTSANYDAKITVGYSSPISVACDVSIQVGTNDNGRNLGNSPLNRDAEIAWYAQQGVVYYIVVHGAAGQVGTYDLSFRCDGTAAPSNDGCAGARTFHGCVTDYNLTTYNASNDNYLDPIDGPLVANKGVWFKLTNVSGPQVLTSCGETWFDDRLFVWEVPANAGCAAVDLLPYTYENDDYCLEDAQVSFPTFSGRDYYILLSGYTPKQRGSYDLRLCGTEVGKLDNAGPDATLTASPNPANTQVRFDYTVQQDGAVTIALYNLAGQQVATVQSDALQAGMSASADLDVSALPAGMYVYRAQIDGQLQSGKLHIAH